MNTKLSRNYLFSGIFLLCISVFLDLLSTYLAGGGSFEHEQNPIQKKYNLGWVSFSMWLFVVQIPYVLAFYFHAIKFPSSIDYLPTASIGKRLRNYFLNRFNTVVFIQISAGIINFWGYYFIRVNTIYRLLVTFPNNMMGWYYDTFISNYGLKDIVFNNKPVPNTDNPIELFIAWYHFIFLQDVVYIQMICEFTISTTVLCLFLNRYFFYKPTDLFYQKK